MLRLHMALHMMLPRQLMPSSAAALLGSAWRGLMPVVVLEMGMMVRSRKRKKLGKGKSKRKEGRRVDPGIISVVHATSGLQDSRSTTRA